MPTRSSSAIPRVSSGARGALHRPSRRRPRPTRNPERDPMDLSRNAQQEQLRQDIIAFAKQSLGEDFLRRERAGEFSRALWQECARFGIQGLAMPEEYGGSGLDVLS